MTVNLAIEALKRGDGKLFFATWHHGYAPQWTIVQEGFFTEGVGYSEKEIESIKSLEMGESFLQEGFQGEERFEVCHSITRLR